MPRDPNCSLCPLGGTGRSTCVWGEWWNDGTEWSGPTVMVVGINPGRLEDDLGRPFVGPSGVMLKGALRAAGIHSAYLTNAYKCASEPDMEYARACAGYLEEEFAQVKPSWVLVLGNIPLQRIMGKGTVGVMAGKEQWSARYECWLLPAPHPAAILRNRGAEPGWLADIMRFGRLIRGELEPPPNKPPVQVELISSGKALAGMTRLMAAEPVIAYDFEANTQPWWSRGFRPYTIAFSFGYDHACVVPLAHPDVDKLWRRVIWRWLGGLREIMTDPQTTRLVHNGVYDDLVWYRLTGWLPQPSWDTMIGLQLLDENAPKSLKWAGRAHLGWPDWDIDARKYHALGALYEYNGYDAAALPALWDKQRFALAEDAWLQAYAERLEMPKLRALERMLARGIWLDRSIAAQLLRRAWKEREAADALLPADLNPASPRQVARWLYADLKLPVLESGKQHPSTSEAVINRLAQKYPGARAILDCRRPRKKITTYFRPLDRATRASFDGRFHPEMRTTSVETGRLSGFFHTTPRDTSVRPIFSAPPGRTLLAADYRQIEARLCAWMAVGRPDDWEGVPRGSMLWAFHEDQDIYSLFAALALRKPFRLITKSERQDMGKVPVLAQLYDISAQGLQEYAWRSAQIDWPLQEAHRLHALFRRTFPEFPLWHRFEEIKLRERGWTRSPIGRLRRLPDATYGQRDAIRAGINAPPQSLASDITQTAMVLLDQMGARVVGNVHDALLFEAPDDQVQAQARVIAEVMTRGALEHLAPLGLRLPPGLVQVEITAGPWGLGRPVET